jgi:hypothetical protein
MSVQGKKISVKKFIIQCLVLKGFVYIQSIEHVDLCHHLISPPKLFQIDTMKLSLQYWCRVHEGKVVMLKYHIKNNRLECNLAYGTHLSLPSNIHYYILCIFAKGQTKNLKGLRSKNNLPYLRCDTHCNLWCTTHP